MPYQGVAFALLLGVGLATAAVLFFLGQRVPESPHGSYDSKPPQNDPPPHSNSWEQRPGNGSRRRRRSDQSDSNNCAICFDEMTEDVKSLPCKHKFHSKCINQWFKESSQICPLCRKCAI